VVKSVPCHLVRTRPVFANLVTNICNCIWENQPCSLDTFYIIATCTQHLSRHSDKIVYRWPYSSAVTDSFLLTHAIKVWKTSTDIVGQLRGINKAAWVCNCSRHLLWLVVYSGAIGILFEYFKFISVAEIQNVWAWLVSKIQSHNNVATQLCSFV